MMVLENTRRSRFLPGSNLKGEPAGAAWVFLLDRLELGRTLCLGSLPPTSLSMLAPLADEVMVWEPRSHQRRALRRWIESSEYRNLSVAARPQAAWQLHELRADLIVRARRHPGWSEVALQVFLRSEARSYCETEEHLGWRVPCPQQHDMRPGEPGSSWLRLMPSRGQIRSAVPLGDSRTQRYFVRQQMWGTTSRLPLLGRVQRVLARGPLPAPWRGRLAVLHGKHFDGSTRLPAYLRQLAQQQGFDFERHRWGFWARGEYLSQKVLFYLFPDAEDTPDAVVKLVRHARFNGRLENEFRALRRLHELSPELRRHVPQALFLGHPGNLAAVGESMVQGRPFTHHTDGSSGCPFAQQAVQWLTDVAYATAQPVAPARVAEALAELLSQFQSIYHLESGELGFLQEQISRIAASPRAFPVVAQHGDPGPWNLFVRPEGDVVFLDWEGAEERGMPLWDLFYFLRSYVLLGRVRGLQSRLETFSHTFLQESPLSSWVLGKVDGYCERLGLDRDLVEPLFFTCWMHRGLKESARLRPAGLGQGRFLQLLRHCMAQRESPGLRRLFAATQTLRV